MLSFRNRREENVSKREKWTVEVRVRGTRKKIREEQERNDGGREQDDG